MAAAKTDSKPVVEKLAELNSNVNDSIINLFECPVCYEYLIPPIYQCKNSHHVCALCKAKMEKCPSCTELFLDSRSVFAEQIAEFLLYPCKNLEVGCQEKHTQKEIGDHLKICPFRFYTCMPGNGCEWKGRYYDILTHMTESHSEFAWMEAESNLYYDFNYDKEINDTQIVSACQEIFWYHFLCKPQEQKMYLAVRFIGRKELACNFSYEFLLTSDTDLEKTISIKNRTHTDLTEFRELIESEECIILDYALLRRYVGGFDHFSFNMRIAKVVPFEEK